MAAGIPTRKEVMTLQWCLTREFLLIAIALNFLSAISHRRVLFKNSNDYPVC